MITSSTDIFRTLAGDPLIAAIAKIRIIEGNPSLNPEDGVIIYVSKYPKAAEFEASWYIWIIDFDNEPLDVVISQVRRNFPSFQILEDGAIVRGVLTEVKTTRTEIAPAAPQKISIEPYLEALNEKFEELRESIEDRMLLVNSGRPGRDGKDGKDGRPGRDGRDGSDLQATEVELKDLKDVYIEDAKKDQVLTYDGESWIAKYFDQRYSNGGGLTYEEIELLQGIKSTGEPMGFVDRADSEFSFDDSTRTLTLTPINEKFVVWVKSKRFSIGESVSVQIPDTTGLYFVYFDTEGNLEYQTDYFYWDSEAPAAYIYWDAEANICPYLADERHGIVLDWQTHEYLHRTRGSVIANGFGIYGYVLDGTGALDSDAQFSLVGGTFFDEDLEINISHSETPDPDLFQQDLQGPAKIGVFYKIGSIWKLDAATSFAVKKAATRPYYNSHSGNTFELTEVSNNRFVNYYVVATHNLRAPIIAIMGQAQHVNITDAQAEDFNSLNLSGFPSKEFRFLYKVTFKTGNFANTIHSVIASIQDLRNYSGQFVAALDIGSIRIDQLDAPIESVSFGGQRITNLGTPVDGSDAATKAYVDSSVSDPNLNVSGDTGSILIDDATDVLGILGGTGLSSVASGNNLTINLDNTTVIAGSYGSSGAIATFTVDAQGRLTAAGTSSIATALSTAADGNTSGSVTLLSQTLSILGGTGLTSSASNQAITLSLDNTAVTPAAYGAADSIGTFTVDAQGRLTAASSISVSILHTQVSDFDTGVQQNRLDQLTAPTAAVSLNSQKITNLATPSDPNDATNKAYVDNAISGLTWKESVHLLAASNITLTGTDGTLAVDSHAVLTSSEIGYRLLLIGQTTSSQNGIYEYTVSGGNYTLVRTSDADTYQELVGAAVFVKEGTLYANTGWLQSNHYISGFSGQNWVQFSGAGAYAAGAGLTSSGTTFNVGTVSATRIVVNADNIDLATSGVSAGTYQSVTVDTYGRVTGGTNPTTLNGYGITDAQPLDATLTALAGVSTSANQLIYATGSDQFSTTSITSLGRDIIDSDTTASARTALGLAIGTDVQAYDADLAALSGMQTGAASALALLTSTEVAILDGATVTTSELNVVDGGTAATSTTLAQADRMVINDNGTMVQVALSDLVTFLKNGTTSGFDIDGGSF